MTPVDDRSTPFADLGTGPMHLRFSVWRPSTSGVEGQRLAEQHNADERTVRGCVLLVLVVGLVVLGCVA